MDGGYLTNHFRISFFFNSIVLAPARARIRKWKIEKEKYLDTHAIHVNVFTRVRTHLQKKILNTLNFEMIFFRKEKKINLKKKLVKTTLFFEYLIIFCFLIVSCFHLIHCLLLKMIWHIICIIRCTHIRNDGVVCVCVMRMMKNDRFFLSFNYFHSNHQFNRWICDSSLKTSK